MGREITKKIIKTIWKLIIAVAKEINPGLIIKKEEILSRQESNPV